MSEYVVDGTQFMCDQCGAPHSVTVPGSPAKGQGKKMASESNSFIPPNGGPCKKILIAGSPTPCALPSKPDSAGQSKLKIAGALAMGSGCKYKCPAGGTLTVLSPGQTKAKAGASAGSAAGVASAAVAGVTAAGGGGGDDEKDEKKPKKKKYSKKEARERSKAKKMGEGGAQRKGCPSNNIAQNKMSDGAKQEIQRKIGRKLTQGEERMIHDQITGQNYTYKEIVKEGVNLFKKY